VARKIHLREEQSADIVVGFSSRSLLAEFPLQPMLV